MYDQDIAFVTMLLTMSLSPNREEYAHPLSGQELSRLEQIVQKNGLRNIGRLLGMDISGLMLKLDISEEDAFRIFTLLNRSVQLTYVLENMMSKYGIGVWNCHGADYPERLQRKMGEAAPPILYYKGNMELLKKPSLAIVGMSGVKTTPEVRESVETLVRWGTQAGYVILSGGEPGVSRLAANLTKDCGGSFTAVVGGEMGRHTQESPVSDLLSQESGLLISVEHPEAMFTSSHAITRNKIVFSLADAAFILNTDGKRGESEAIRNKYCDWIYAWTGCKENQALINRGAIAVSDIPRQDFDLMSKHWKRAESEQISMFDLM